MIEGDTDATDTSGPNLAGGQRHDNMHVRSAVEKRDAEDAAMRAMLRDLWGPEQPYTAPPEATSSWFSRYYYGWVYDTLILASKEKLSRDVLPSPTKDVLTHDCGMRLSESVRASLEAQCAWDAIVGVNVTSTLDPSSRGVLRWVGVPQQGGYTRVMAGIEWSSAPAPRTAAKEADAQNSPFFDGVVHGEKLFVPERLGVSTLEETTHVTILPSADLADRSFPPPQRLNLTTNLVKTMPQLFWTQVPYAILAVIFQLAMPWLLQKLVAFFNAETHAWSSGLTIVAAMFCAQCAQSFCQQRYNYLSVKAGLQYRSALNSVIFEKCFTIASKSLARPEMNAGRIINMVSTDVERVYFFMMFCMMLWSSPLLLLIAMGMLARLVGWCAILALVAFFLTLPINARLMNIQMNARRSIAKATDVRVKATNEFLSGIRVTKFMTWEPRFIANIEAKRAVELYYLKKNQTCRVQTSFLNTATPMVMIAIVFITYYNLGHDLTPEVVFPTISLLAILRQPFQQIPWVLTMTLQYLVSITRVRSFLECENTACSTVGDIEALYAGGKSADASCDACAAAAVMNGVSVTAFVPVRLPFAPKVKVPFVSKLLRMMCCEGCKPAKRVPPPMAVAQELEEDNGSPRTASSTTRRAPPSAKPPTQTDEFYQLEEKELLTNVDLQIPRGKLTVVLGPTGSGKSTLLQTLLGQFEIRHGRVWCSRNIAYVPQQAWIMNATVRDNILFFAEEEDANLREAIRVSQLGPDLDLLAGGLETEIGEKGVNLSGGQKARVSLARAVYAERDMYLLDDPLSALDAHVGERVVTECVLGKLAHTTRVLATHQMHVVPRADYVIVLGDHSVRFHGDVQSFTQSPVYHELSSKEENEAREKAAEKDERTKESEAQSKDLLDQGESTLTPARAKASAVDAEAGADARDATATGASLIVEEEKAKGGVPLSTYVTYFGYCGGTRVAVIAFTVFVVTELLTVSSSVWLSAWSTMRYPLEVTTYLKVYLVLVLLGTCSVPLRYSVSYTAMRRGCVNMHKALLRSVSRGTMEFFDRTPLGRLLNRFSRDIDQIDNGLQMSMISALECFFAISSSMLIMVISQPIVLLALIPCGYVYYRLMVFFNMANREIRRTSSIMKTPVYTLLGELTNGSATIAAYQKSTVVMQEALRRLDVVLSCGNLENTTNRWLAVRIEFLSYVVVTSIAFAGVLSAMRSAGGNDIGLASLAVTMAMQTTGSLNWLVRQVATVEADMNSVERIEYYVHSIPKEDSPEIDAEVDELARRVGLDQEEVMETGELTAPSSPIAGVPNAMTPGSLVFDGVQMRYRDGLPLVLRDVSFRIAPREKVGIVGRTGSGKSTLLLTFMRMVDVSGGSISVNGAPIRSYGLRELRKLFSMIPQDPVLFDGTVRLNVDPFLESSTEEVWAALDMVGLRERIESESEGVDARVQEGGANFSVGQRQLLCMARALLKKGSGFILMDEATANIDPALDRHIQKTVMRAFDEYTVITIAHRLQTVAQYDKIIVMDHGVVAEMGSPRELVNRSGSVFRSMVESMGEAAFTQFMTLVETRGEARIESYVQH